MIDRRTTQNHPIHSEPNWHPSNIPSSRCLPLPPLSQGVPLPLLGLEKGAWRNHHLQQNLQRWRTWTRHGCDWSLHSQGWRFVDHQSQTTDLFRWQGSKQQIPVHCVNWCKLYMLNMVYCKRNIAYRISRHATVWGNNGHTQLLLPAVNYRDSLIMGCA